MSQPSKSAREDRNLSLWEEILEKASTLPTTQESYNLLFLGDDFCGKSSIIDCFGRNQGRLPPELNDTLGDALNYSFVDVKLSQGYTSELSSRLNIWELGGKKDFLKLIKHCMNEKTIHSTIVVIVLDLSKPWTLLESLNRWVKVVQERIRQLTETTSSASFEKLKAFTSSVIEKSKNHFNAQVDSNPEISANIPAAPIDIGVGVPIIVVGNKADTISKSEVRGMNHHMYWGFIQRHLRMSCIKFSGSMMFVSGAKKQNTEKLKQYVEFLLYKAPFTVPADTSEVETFFVPFGWDDEELIKVETTGESAHHHQPFETVILKPSTTRLTAVRAPIMAEEDQEFWKKLSDELARRQEHEADSIHRLRALDSSAPLSARSNTSSVPGSLPQGEKQEDVLLTAFFNTLLSQDSGKKSADQRSMTQSVEMQLNTMRREAGVPVLTPRSMAHRDAQDRSAAQGSSS